MIKVWTQLICMLVLASAGAGFYTSAYFSDLEGLDNLFGSTNLDAGLAGLPIDSQICSVGGEATTMLYFGNLGDLPYKYDLRVDNLNGLLCGSLLAELSLAGEVLYAGPLPDLLVENRQLEPDEVDELMLTVRREYAGIAANCDFDTVFEANQQLFTYNQAFHDVEVTSHSIVSDVASCGPVEPTVNLYLNKQISGETLGYALSDFSYRVTGNNVDTIVPHDSFIPLPEGTYTIEEIVPDGFIKDDWRIGWYGQCERGSTFTTTITIDERNIDHGTLYCEADNQYRPELNSDNDESDSEEAADTDRGDRGDRSSRSGRDSEETVETSVALTATTSATTSATSTESTDVSVAEEAAITNESAESTSVEDTEPTDDLVEAEAVTEEIETAAASDLAEVEVLPEAGESTTEESAEPEVED